MKQKQSWWLLSSDQVCQLLKTEPERGLSYDEAAHRLTSCGHNVLKETQDISTGQLLLRQFTHMFVFILIAAGILALLLGSLVDALVIFSVILANALIGFIQEYSAERSLAALRSMTKPQATVIRDGVPMVIASADLVPGDIVMLTAGDVVPADGRLMHTQGLSIDESALTGESVPDVKQHAMLSEGDYAVADQSNMAFMGTLVVKGSGVMVVTETGGTTQFGEIAAYIAQAGEPETQLHRQLKHIGYVLMVMAGIVGVVIVGMGLLQGASFFMLLFTSVSLFVASVPEGLPAVITIALARAVRRMASRHALIRRLAAVESLSSISFICTDKTGTLTQNRMTVKYLYVDDVSYAVDEDLPLDTVYEALAIGVLCNGARLESDGRMMGDPTEGALLAVAAKKGLIKEELQKQFPLIKEYPFDSERMRMGMLRSGPQGYRLFVKGALDSILECASRKVLQGQVYDLSEADRQALMLQNKRYAEQALRVIAVAYRDGSPASFTETEEDEKDLVFVGLFAMIDPPRPEARHSLMKVQQAGIRTLMLTGDHKETARAIGLAVGLIEEGGEVLTGADLDLMSDQDLLPLLYRVSIYARISVAHKIRIVEVLRKAGERVAMTGDGVNDAPALKAADIGIAMGIMGTNVAKEASDMIITDDNYASIAQAIEEGRGMYESIVKFVRYQLSSNLAEIFVMLWGGVAYSLLTTEQPPVVLLPAHLLWINLVSDGLPAVALVFDPLHEGLMAKKPSDFTQSLTSVSNTLHLVGVGLILSLGVMGAYFYGLTYSPQVGQTMAFTTLVLLEFVRLAAVRAEFHLPFFSNYLVLVAMGISLLLQLLILYMSFLEDIFKTVPLETLHWCVMIGVVIATWGAYRLFRRIVP